MTLKTEFTQAEAVYRAAFERTAADWDAKDQAGFSAIQAEFPALTIHEQLDLLQASQEAMDAAEATVWSAAA